jgi:hypothetical protein
MKIKFILIFCIIFAGTTVAQDRMQVFQNAGFKVKCGCELKTNSLYIKLAKQNGINNIIAAYICGENQDNPEIGVANNINITDESASYNKMSSANYGYFEKKTLEVYAKNLLNAGFKYNYTTYQGVSALEYSFDQQGLPTKAIFFMKNKKTFLLQVGTRSNLNSKFNLLKYSFELL